MKIDKTFKIKEKYFNAILKLEKPFELRHFYLAPNSIVKLDCIDSNNIDTGRYLIFKSGKCYEIQEGHSIPAIAVSSKWFDKFCWEYITKAPTYLIEIAEILEVK